MTRLASLALLVACSLPAFGQGLILGAPAQGGSGGGSGAIDTTGSGLSGDGSSGDPLTLDAVLEELATWSTPAAGQITGPLGVDLFLSADTADLWLQGDNVKTNATLQVYPTLLVTGALDSQANYFSAAASSLAAITADVSGDAIENMNVAWALVNTGGTTTTATGYLDLRAKASSGTSPVTFIRCNGDTNVADVGTRAIMWGSAIGTNQTGLRQLSSALLQVTTGSITGMGGLAADNLRLSTDTTINTSDVRLEVNSGRLDVREGDDSALADLGAALIVAADTGLDYHSVLSGASLTAANTRFASFTDSAIPTRFYAASATAGNGTFFQAARFRGTLASPTALSAGDLAFSIAARGAGASGITADREMCRIEFLCDGTVGAEDMPGRIDFYTTLDGANSSTKRWEIDNAGHFLAGTDNSWDVGASGATRPRTYYAGTSFVGPNGSAATPSFQVDPGDGLFFVSSGVAVSVGGTEELRVAAASILLGTQHLTFSSTSLGSETVGLVADASGILRVSDADTGTGDLFSDDVFLGSRDASGWVIQSASGSALNILEGDGTALTAGDEFSFGSTTGDPMLRSNPSATNSGHTFVGDNNSSFYRIGADNVGIATGGTLALDVTSAQVVRVNVALTADTDNGANLGSSTVGWSRLYMETGIDTTAGDAATINAPAGRFRKDTSGVTFTLTNDRITANSIVLLANHNTGMEAIGLSVVAGAGSATISFSAAPGSNFDVGFWVINND